MKYASKEVIKNKEIADSGKHEMNSLSMMMIKKILSEVHFNQDDVDLP